MRRCRNCGYGRTSEKRENYLYNESGLPGVVLADIRVRRCKKCGMHEALIPNVAGLHRELAHALIKKQNGLSGVEVRFLRKYLGWSGVDFSKHVGAEPSTVSNWERGKSAIGSSADRLLRLMVAHGDPVQDYSLEELTKIKKTSKKCTNFRFKASPKRDWLQEASP